MKGFYFFKRVVLRPIFRNVPFVRPLWWGLVRLYDAFYRVFFGTLWGHNRANYRLISELANFVPEFWERDIPTECDYPFIMISVITFNSSDWVPLFFSSLVKQNYPLKKIHLVVTDHESSDQSMELAQKMLSDVRDRFASVEIETGKNIGFGRRHDLNIRKSPSRFCLVVNVDMEFTENTIAALVESALKDIARGCKVASWESRQIPFEHPKYYDPVTGATPWVSHACVLMDKELFEKVGGYDQNIFMYCEDVELSFRFRLHGYWLRYVPNSVVKHFSYQTEHQIKPLQFLGSTSGNFYLRMLYGDAFDTFVGYLLVVLLIIRPPPKELSRIVIIKSLVQYRKVAYKSKLKNYKKGNFPFFGFDYTFKRRGSFYPVDYCSHHSVVVSVIIRTFKNRSKLLKGALLSVLNQTYSSIEVLVVQDGGDSENEVVKNIHKLNKHSIDIKFIANPKLGRSAAANRGLREAQGAYIMFLDDDDLLFADHIEILVSYLLANQKVSAAYSLAFEAQAEQSLSGQRIVKKISTPSVFDQEWDYSVLLQCNFIPIQSILFCRSLYERRGGFDESLDHLEDWNLWLRYGYKNLFKLIPKTTSIFFTPSDNKIRLQRNELFATAYERARSRALNEIK